MNTILQHAEWHLAHSQPAQLVDYFNPCTPFARQINLMTSRFRAVEELCDAPSSHQALSDLRDALAFHLVRMSFWWDFAFCPRGATGVSNPNFLSYVKRHVARSYDDEAFFDLFTWQRHMHAGDEDQILIVGRDPGSPKHMPIYYGIDGARRFRFSLPGEAHEPHWACVGYRDFAAAWLAAWTCHCPHTSDGDSLDMHLRAEREHHLARIWHQRHFCKPCKATVVPAYIEACAQASTCRTPFGCMEFTHITGHLAHEVMDIASDTQSDLVGMFDDAGARSIAADAIAVVRLHANAYRTECLDPVRVPCAAGKRRMGLAGFRPH